MAWGRPPTARRCSRRRRHGDHRARGSLPSGLGHSASGGSQGGRCSAFRAPRRKDDRRRRSRGVDEAFVGRIAWAHTVGDARHVVGVPTRAAGQRETSADADPRYKHDATSYKRHTTAWLTGFVVSSHEYRLPDPRSPRRALPIAGNPLRSTARGAVVRHRAWWRSVLSCHPTDAEGWGAPTSEVAAGACAPRARLLER